MLGVAARQAMGGGCKIRKTVGHEAEISARNGKPCVPCQMLRRVSLQRIDKPGLRA